MSASLLLIDDDRSLLRVLEYQLSEAGYQVRTATDGIAGLRLFERHLPDVVLTDINMPGMSGLELITKLREQNSQVPIIVITAYGTLDNAIKTTQFGASDYLTKPFSFETLQFTIEKNLRIGQLYDENANLRRQIFDKYDPQNLIGQSSVIKKIKGLIEKAAKSNSLVLITGESGTGKELVARAIHQKSDRSNQSFTVVNCAAIPANLIESELFGHVRGAFTGALRDQKGKFELADGGTIFLDEIGDLDLNLQAKLLRVLQEYEIQRIGDSRTRKIDVRVLAATNHDLQKMVAEGSFRDDLFYRINILPIHVPPLRDRREDIPLLIRFFLQKMAPVRRFDLSDTALKTLVSYDWPGNVRELENMIERLSILYAGERVNSEHIPLKQVDNRHDLDIIKIPFPEEGIALEEIERMVLEKALNKFNSNQTKAAQFLKIPRHTLIYRMKKYNL